MKKIIDEKTVSHIAELGRISLSPQEIRLFTKQLHDVLKYMQILNEIKTDSIKPTYQVIDNTQNITRKDKVIRGLSQKSALSQGNKVFKGYFLTSNVFENKFVDKSSIIDKKHINIDKYNAVLKIVNKKGNCGHKDLFMTKGIETTAGSLVLKGYIPQYSATIVNQLEDAGYITKYKLNQDAWGHGSSGENSDFGSTNNPWNPKKVAGGSSSGSAVVVANGECEISTGTDTCGSIRMPSSYNNVSGIKPTYGAVSRWGLIAFSSSLDCPGLIARNVKTLKKSFDFIYKKDQKDATSQSRIRDQKIKTSVKTIGIPKEFFEEKLDPEIKKAFDKTVLKFKELGYRIKNISLPNSKYGIASYYIIAPTETSSNLARYDGIRYGNGRNYFQAEAKRRIMLGTFSSSYGYNDKYYEKAARIRTLICIDFEKAFKTVDIILAPTSPSLPFDIGEKIDDPLKLYLMDIFMAPASLSGLPSLAIPCGFSKTGLPMGIQLIGRRWSEDALFATGIKYQESTNWHKLTPKI